MTLEAHLRTAAPDDWSSWLVYGDSLLERGDVRGELIQLEHQRAGGADVGGAIDALVKAHQSGWAEGLPAGVTVTTWRHGFPTTIAMTWSDESPALVKTALATPAARFVTGLALCATRNDEDTDEEDPEAEPEPIDFTRFADVDATGLRTLDLAQLRVGPKGAELLAGNATLAGITTLDLRYTWIQDEGMQALAGATHLRGISSLHLQRCALTSAGALALSKASFALRELDLRYNAIGKEGAAALTRASFLATLEWLRLHREDVGDEGASALAGCQALRPFTRASWRNA